MIIRDKFIYSAQNICCDPSSEPSRRDDSEEGSQYMYDFVESKKLIKYSLLSRALIV